MAQDERSRGADDRASPYRDDRGGYHSQGAGGMGNIPVGGSYVGGGGQYGQGDYSRGGDSSIGGTGHHDRTSGGFGGGLPGGYDRASQYGARHGGTGAADIGSSLHSGAMTVGGYGGMVGSGELKGDANYGGNRPDRGRHGLYGDIGCGDFGRDQMSGFGGQHTSYGSGSDAGPGHYDQFGQRQVMDDGRQEPHRDEHYHALRQRHLEQCDRDYEEFRREQQERFNAEFESWRASRS